MRNIFFMFSLLSLMQVHGQGIKFEEGSWNDVKAKAKSANKLIFLDIYTSWCGPCKMMASTVFPLQDVGEYFNSHFLNYKIDAEKGEGKDIASRYEVNAYPTYLFIHPDGSLVYRKTGGMSKDEFLMEASTARLEFNDPKPMVVWDKEYAGKKNDKDFLRSYIIKRQKKSLASNEIIDHYVSLLSEEELLQKENLSVLLNGPGINVNGAFFNCLLKNKQRVIDVMGWGDTLMYDNILIDYLWIALDLAKKRKDVHLMEKIINIRKELAEVRFSNEVDIGVMQMEYYTAVKDEQALRKTLYRQSELLLNYNALMLQMKVMRARKEFDNAVAAGKMSQMSEKDIEISRENIPTMINGQLAFHIRELSDYAVKGSSDPQLLTDCLGWVDVSAKIWDHFTCNEAKAKLLSKLSRKDEAVVEIKKAVEGYNAMVAKSNAEHAPTRERLENELKMIEKGNNM